MTQFHNVNFPRHLAQGASGGPVRSTETVSLASGGEHRNNSHANSRRQYNAGARIQNVGDTHSLIAFFEARRGKLHSFRFQDPMDYMSCGPSEMPSASDQFIGEGDGARTEFQLVKTYADSAGAWTRRITKPRAETVLISLNGNSESVSVDELTGVIAFAVPPPLGVIIRAGFEFDVPVRFDTDFLDLSPDNFGAGKTLNVPLMEVLHE